MRSLTRLILACAFVALFAVGTIVTTPVYAWCDKWPHQDYCKEGTSAPEPSIPSAFGPALVVSRLLFWV